MGNEAVLKKVRLATILFGIAYLAFAIALIIKPVEFQRFLGIFLGAAAILFGTWRIVNFFVKEIKENLFAGSLFAGSAFCLLGLWSLLCYGSLLNYLSLVYCGMLLIGTMLKVQNAIDLNAMRHSKWWVLLILGGLSFLFGLILFFRPGFAETRFSLFAAIFILCDAITDFVCFIMYQLRAHKIKKAVKEGVPVDAPKPEAAVEEAPEPETQVTKKRHRRLFGKKDAADLEVPQEEFHTAVDSKSEIDPDTMEEEAFDAVEDAEFSVFDDISSDAEAEELPEEPEIEELTVDELSENPANWEVFSPDPDEVEEEEASGGQEPAPAPWDHSDEEMRLDYDPETDEQL